MNRCLTQKLYLTVLMCFNITTLLLGGLRVQKDYNLGQNQLFTVCATCSFLIILKPIDMVKKADFCPN